ncbi:hypothetical protein HEK616_17210 [Streptomyces nigrescens]|uniref:Secreted protein n=1 Tax=Streptomyces nigrescens TaxID=1920 RepID=A0ABN6QPY5_STRNI|nr:hypothetical protein HEK616_17210 [Streptomyces nigrescens]
MLGGCAVPVAGAASPAEAVGRARAREQVLTSAALMAKSTALFLMLMTFSPRKQWGVVRSSGGGIRGDTALESALMTSSVHPADSTAHRQVTESKKELERA